MYSYKVEDIVILIDEELDDGDQKQPTRANIVEEIRNLVRDAEENDRFFFHCKRYRVIFYGPLADVI